MYQVLGRLNGTAVCLQALLMETEGKDTVEFVGNRTECALLMLLREWGGKGYKQIRDDNHSAIERIYGFTSERKMASILIRTPESLRLYNKVTTPTPHIPPAP